MKLINWERNGNFKFERKGNLEYISTFNEISHLNTSECIREANMYVIYSYLNSE